MCPMHGTNATSAKLVKSSICYKNGPIATDVCDSPRMTTDIEHDLNID